MMIKAALAMEGGGLKGLFTSGVVDILMENDIYTEYVSGISAGALEGLDYVAKQPARTANVNINFVNDEKYFGMKALLKYHMIFNFDYLFGEISHELDPFDYNTFESSPMRFSCAATNVRTGKAEFFEKGKCSDIYTAVRASSSLALVSKMVTLDGKKYLDGGYSVPIPYQKCFDEGYDKVIIITTKPKGFRKTADSARTRRIYLTYYHRYPEFAKALINSYKTYNAQMREIDRLEAEGKVIVIRPEKVIKLDRIEKDREKLQRLSDEGKRIGELYFPKIKEYLGI